MAKRIRPARHYQRADNAVRQIATGSRRIVARDLRGSLKHLSALVPDRVEQLIANGNWKEIHSAVDWHHWGEILKKPFARLGKVYEAGAALGVQKINNLFIRHGRRTHFRNVRKAIGDRFNFDLYDQGTIANLRAAQDKLIAEMTATARDTIETIVMTGARQGLSAAAITDDIRQMIGLTNMQAQAVMNYRGMLTTLDSTALERQLRNTSMDQTVRDSIDSGTLLDADVIDQLVEDYTSNYLDYRASTIAQTESSRAVNDGLHDAYSQAIDRGALPDDAVRREWELGDEPCPICESIPDNNPDGVGVDEPFDSDDGPVDDPPIHPNCMCSVNYITDISMIPDDGEEGDDSAALDENTDTGDSTDTGAAGEDLTDALAGFDFAIPEDLTTDAADEIEAEQASLLDALANMDEDTTAAEESQAAFEERAIAQAEAEAQYTADLEAEQQALQDAAEQKAQAAIDAEQKAIGLQARQFQASTYDAKLEAQAAAKDAQLAAQEAKDAQAAADKANMVISKPATAVKNAADVLPTLLKEAADNELGAASIRLADNTVIRTAIDQNGRRQYYINNRRSTLKQIRELLIKKQQQGMFGADFVPAAGRATYTKADFARTDWKVQTELTVDRTTISMDERSAAQGYKNGEYRQINRELREGKVGSMTQRTIDRLDSVISKGRISKDGLLFRGVQSLNPGQFASKIGGEMDMQSFISTSTSASFASSWGGSGVMFRIIVQAGQVGLEYAKLAGRADSEHEVILPRTARFMIHSVEGRYVNLVYLGS